MKKRIVIAVTGTPGTGKTAVAKELAKNGWLYLELNKFVARKKLYTGFDKKRKSWIVNEKKLERFAKNFVVAHPEKNIVIDSHVSHILPEKFFSAVFVLRCNPVVLEKRLKKKRWKKEKIRENLEAEIIGLIEWEAKQMQRNIFSINSSGSAKSVAKKILKILRSKRFKYSNI